jgi:hypothetical protein
MRTLELKDICGYLPYDLKYTNYHHNSIHDITITNGKLQDVLDYGEFYKPVLRPLSDLYKLVTHNGKEITPLIECAKLSFPMISNFNVNSTTKMCYAEGSHLGVLQFKYENGFIALLLGETSQYWIVDNQYQLFDFLHELKIDYRGLIESGLAIDCNTLENNPYK